MSRNEKDYEVVGDIRIKQPKKKKNKNKKTNNDSTPFGIKIFVWFMFIVFFASAVVPLVYYLVSVISGS